MGSRIVPCAQFINPGTSFHNFFGVKSPWMGAFSRRKLLIIKNFYMKTRLAERNYSRAIEPHASLKSGEGMKLEQSVSINRSPDEIYSFWRQLENLPRFMTHIKSVTQTGGGV